MGKAAQMKIKCLERILSWANARPKSLNTEYKFRINKHLIIVKWNGKQWNHKIQAI